MNKSAPARPCVRAVARICIKERHRRRSRSREWLLRRVRASNLYAEFRVRSCFRTRAHCSCSDPTFDVRTPSGRVMHFTPPLLIRGYAFVHTAANSTPRCGAALDDIRGLTLFGRHYRLPMAIARQVFVGDRNMTVILNGAHEPLDQGTDHCSERQPTGVLPKRQYSWPLGSLVLVPPEERFARDIARHLSDRRIGDTYFDASISFDRRISEITAGFMRAHVAGSSAFVTCRRSDGAFIGGIKVSNRRLSYFVAPAHWAQGYGTEMVMTYCRLIWPETGLQPLEAHLLRENLASRRILERVGFRFGGLYTCRGRSQLLYTL
jgi:RimJ/RimL family protein N-acetyltransferase